MRTILKDFMRLVYTFLFTSTLVFGHGGEAHNEKKNEVNTATVNMNKVEIINKEYKVKIKPIFKRSCFDCHSNKTNFPWYYKIPGVKQLIDSDIKEAKTHLDFSKDYPFISHGSPVNDLESISKSLKKGSMPPSQYLWLHSNSKLSNKEIKIIQDWIKRSLERLK